MVDGEAPLGLFDSGVGGLTVFRRLAEALPAESIVYLGDTARVPYGTKSGATVTRYALGCAQHLLDRGVKLLVVACNAASAHALEALRDELGVPVIGVIEPGARRAVDATRRGRVGVLGTASTIASGAYQSFIHALAPEVTVACQACPLFVPLAEEGWVTGDVPSLVTRRYLEAPLEAGVDTLLLGCTHYPLLRDVIEETAGPDVTVIDSAQAVSAAVRDALDAMGLRRAQGAVRHTFLVTDAPETFARTGRRFLGGEIGPIEWVDVAPHASRY